MIKEHLQISIHQLNLLRECISLWGEDEGWSETDLEWALETLYKQIEWLTILLGDRDE